MKSATPVPAVATAATLPARKEIDSSSIVKELRLLRQTILAAGRLGSGQPALSQTSTAPPGTNWRSVTALAEELLDSTQTIK